MGIPTFFRSILSGNKKVIQGAQAGVLDVDYFFMDFNSLVYNEWASIPKELRVGSVESVEKTLIQNVVKKTIHIVNSIVRPSGYTYIAFDGPAPKAKMVQQRSRRFKSVQSMRLLSAYKKNTIQNTWDPSCHICPGTSFMEKLSHSLQKAMANKQFHSSVILSDSNTPGEGEHKILPRIRNLQKSEQEKEKTVVIFSPDGDMISLILMTQKKNCFLLRYIDADSEHENHLLDKGFIFLYCHLNMVKQDFHLQMTKTYTEVDDTRILLDYNFLLAMVGNDFVPSLPFLKIRSGGLDMLITIYNRLRPLYGNDYLISIPASINMAFLRDIFLELSKMENAEMRKEYALLAGEYMGKQNYRRSSRESTMSDYEIIESRFYHMSLFHPDHPLGKTYRQLWGAIDFQKEKHEWKAQYYRFFCGFNPSDYSAYNDGRTQMVKNYLESLLFTLYYYTDTCPSWSWYYQYRVAPIPSDVYSVLSKNKIDINRLYFEKSQPYTPFQQLMTILPPQNLHILPLPLKNMALSEKWKYLYPTEFQVDALAGFKYIYSEAILPENDNEKEFLGQIREIEQNSLTEGEKHRNRINSTVKKIILKNN